MTSKNSILTILLAITILVSCKSQHHSNNSNNSDHQNMENKKANNLINESSPYLLQHAYNPVDWHPWGDEALEKAKNENKPLIISIGYASLPLVPCHGTRII